MRGEVSTRVLLIFGKEVLFKTIEDSQTNCGDENALSILYPLNHTVTMYLKPLLIILLVASSFSVSSASDPDFLEFDAPEDFDTPTKQERPAETETKSPPPPSKDDVID